jgi:hypothetical protein
MSSLLYHNGFLFFSVLYIFSSASQWSSKDRRTRLRFQLFIDLPHKFHDKWRIYFREWGKFAKINPREIRIFEFAKITISIRKRPQLWYYRKKDQ